MRGVPRTIDELKQQVIRGRNYEQLYRDLKPKYDAALRRITALEAENKRLRQTFQAATEAQAARIEQLETIVFGQKASGGHQAKLPLRIPRPAHTYHRPVPSDDAITNEATVSVSVCKHCSGALEDIQEYIRYEEDIVLGALVPTGARLKTVTKRTIERGYCTHCGVWTAGADLRGEHVTLGPHVQLLILYLVAIQGLTYEQIRRQLRDLYGFAITDGEIEVILDRQRTALLPAYEQLKVNIRAGPAHFDETTYSIQAEQGNGYAWVMAGVDGSAAEHDVVFRLADSRGSGNAKALAGDGYNHVGITDRYPGYKHLFETVQTDGAIRNRHQICWAHLQRNARDITQLECLNEAAHEQAVSFYGGLCQIYVAVRRYRQEPPDQTMRVQQANGLLAQTITLCQPDERDPKQLKDLKAGILAYQDSLFVCLAEPNVPPDNNKAERLIRQLVLKRKRSVSLKSSKGARIMEVVLSVAWSLWYRDREQFFPSLQALLVG